MFKFGTKSETLQFLKEHVKACVVLPQLAFTVSSWQEQQENIKGKIIEQFGDGKVIVRSSAKNEDTFTESHAGQYLSVLNVQGIESITEAIYKVAGSFVDKDIQNQIFIQPMLENVEMSGVIFTMNPSNGGHYYVVNYDDTTGSTNSITSGEGKQNKLFYCFKSEVPKEPRLNRVINMAKELEETLEHMALDIEFAFSSNNLYLLQARPLIVNHKIEDFTIEQKMLNQIAYKVKHSNEKMPYLHGNRSIYGVMPDWNPAEMIGLHPKPLALSLYKYLITDGTWAYQRDNYGYHNLRSFPLMVDFCGLPYIDVRVSFNSFLPKDINENLCEKLANYYLEALAAQPDKHDKVEFEIILSCYTFTLDKRLEQLQAKGFTREECVEFANALRNLTNNIINVKDGLWITDNNKIQILIQHHKQIMESNMNKISKIYWLLEDCNRYGTLPFAGLARAGFIAVQLLKSLVECNILSEEEYNCYMAEMDTVSSQMTRDSKILKKDEFLNKYGHLRPGTYDITSKRYDATEHLMDTKKITNQESGMNHQLFKLSLEQYQQIDELMKICGFSGDVLALFKFIKAAIEGREYAKFVFTQSLSDAIELIADLGMEMGYSREEMSYVNICDIVDLYSCADNWKEKITQSITVGKKKYNHAIKISLPPVILDSEDVYQFHLPDCLPNYITLEKTSGEICTNIEEDLEGKIVLISAADPGYDWIFSKGIAGFITAFGGANSHMAIRAGELSIPAVIGIGEKQFLNLQSAKRVYIDCQSKRIEVLD